MTLLNDPMHKTFLCTNGSSTIDLVFISKKHCDNFKVAVEPSLETKHQIVSTTFNTTCFKSLRERSRPIRRTDQGQLATNFDNDTFYEYLQETGNANNAFNVIISAIYDSKVTSNSKKSKAWFDRDCCIMKNEVRCSYNAVKRSKMGDRMELVKHHSDLVVQFQRTKRQKKASYEETMVAGKIAKAENDINDFWYFWRHSKRKSSPMQVQPEIWYTHFSNMLQSPEPVAIPAFIPIISDDILDAPITLIDVRRAINHAKSSKSPGPDGITYDCYKSAIDILSQPLQALYDYIFTYGTCPAIWLESHVLTLYNGKGQLTSPDAYRGIALQVCAMKLYT